MSIDRERFFKLKDLFIDSINYMDVLARNKEAAGFLSSLSFSGGGVKVINVPNHFVKKKYKMITTFKSDDYYKNIKLIRKFEEIIGSDPFQFYQFQKNIILLNESVCECHPENNILTYTEMYRLDLLKNNDFDQTRTDDSMFFNILDDIITENLIHPVFGNDFGKKFSELNKSECQTLKMFYN